MPIKILTWNVMKRTDGIAEKILEVNPDIAVITEIPKNIQKIKDALLDKGFNKASFILDDCEKYVLICSKSTIKRNELIQIREELRGNIAIVDFQNLVIIGLFVNGFSPCKENNGKKLGEQAIKFLNDVKVSNPNLEIIATGDFDCGYKCKNGYKNFKLLEQQGWKNIWHRDNKVEWIVPNEKLKNGSFRTKDKKGKSIPDHLFATEKIAKQITKPKFLFDYLDIRMPNGVCLSDHAPLVAEIEI